MRQWEMNISASEIPPVFWRDYFPSLFKKKKKKISRVDVLALIPCSVSTPSNLLSSLAYVFNGLALDQVDCDPISD